MNRIKELLKQQGRSQTWLAQKIGRSYIVTTNYCNNKTQPKLPTLYKMAEVMDVVKSYKQDIKQSNRRKAQNPTTE
jgi:putative transcriptional regulator